MIYEAKRGDSLLTVQAFAEMLEFEELLQNNDLWSNETHDLTLDQRCFNWTAVDETEHRVSLTILLLIYRDSKRMSPFCL